jgi:hypothetical protein
MSLFKRIAMLPVAALIISAVPGPIVVPFPKAANEAVIIPPDSPVKFRGWDRSSGYAQFDGRFVLSGTFTYGCGSTCADYDGPVSDSDLQVQIVPDPKVAAVLPNWKNRHNDMLVLIVDGKSLATAIATPRQHAALRSGKIKDLRGRTAIVVDHFETGIECDTANFRARFAGMVKPPEIAKAEFNGNYGCV